MPTWSGIEPLPVGKKPTIRKTNTRKPWSCEDACPSSYPSSSGDEVKRDSKGQRDPLLLRTRWYKSYAPRLRRTYEPAGTRLSKAADCTGRYLFSCARCVSQKQYFSTVMLVSGPESSFGTTPIVRRGYLAHEKTHLLGPFRRPMPRVLARVVPGGWAISYERGTPVQESGLVRMPVSSSL